MAIEQVAMTGEIFEMLKLGMIRDDELVVYQLVEMLREVHPQATEPLIIGALAEILSKPPIYFETNRAVPKIKRLYDGGVAYMRIMESSPNPEIQQFRKNVLTALATAKEYIGEDMAQQFRKYLKNKPQTPSTTPPPPAPPASPWTANNN